MVSIYDTNSRGFAFIINKVQVLQFTKNEILSRLAAPIPNLFLLNILPVFKGVVSSILSLPNDNKFFIRRDRTGRSPALVKTKENFL
jgi:hypothetical protein